MLSEAVQQILKSYTQHDSKAKEAGGILLGQVSARGVFVLKVTTPCGADKASRVGFLRNKQKAQYIIDYEFENSGGKMIYLGEWHTHPEPLPSPSSVDLSMISDQYLKNKINEDFVLLIIRGTKGTYIAMVSNGDVKGVVVNE